MTEPIEHLPLYNELAQGATLPKGRQLTIRWWSHLSKEAILIDVGSNIYHLSRANIKETHFNVIGTIRNAENENLNLTDGLLEKLVGDSLAFPAEDQWIRLPVFAEIVVHLVTNTNLCRFLLGCRFPHGHKDSRSCYDILLRTGMDTTS